MKRTWCFMDLVVGRDGKLVLTKLQAACFHFALFVTVCLITWVKKEFIESMWTLYAAVAVGHAFLDKTGTQVSTYANKKLDTPAVGEVRTESTTTSRTAAPLEP